MSFLVSVNKIYEYPIDKSLSSVYIELGISDLHKLGFWPYNVRGSDSPFRFKGVRSVSINTRAEVSILD